MENKNNNQATQEEIFAKTSVKDLIENPYYGMFHFENLQRELVETKVELKIIEETLIKNTIFGNLKLLKVLRKVEDSTPEFIRKMIEKRLSGKEEYIVISQSKIIDRPKKIYTYENGEAIFVKNNKIMLE